MNNLDPNLITVEWGLLSIFGIFVTLLIPYAEQYYREYEKLGQDADQRRARLWSTVIRWTPIIMLLLLIALTILGAKDAGLGFPGKFVLETALLLTPIIAQLGFIGVTWLLVKYVPDIEDLEQEEITAENKIKPTSLGHTDPTVIRFVNNSDEQAKVWWIDFDGNKSGLNPDKQKPFLLVEKGNEAAQLTYVGHRFLIEVGGRQLMVTATSRPAKVTLQKEGRNK